MLLEIIKKELLDSITGIKFISAFLICCILLPAAFYNGTGRYISKRKEYEITISQGKKELAELEKNSSHAAISRFNKKIIKPPAILYIFSSGVEDAVGYITNNRESIYIPFPNLSMSRYTRNPSYVIYGLFDVVFIVEVILSLLVLLFTFDAITGEKEKGTLKLIISNRLPRDILILGKITGSFISFFVPFISSFLIGLIILLMNQEISLSSENWIRIGLMFLLFTLYLVIFFCLGLFVSSKSSRSTNSLFILLFIWILFVLIIPRMSVIASSLINPIPSIHEHTRNKRIVRSEINKIRNEEERKMKKENPNFDDNEIRNLYKKIAEKYSVLRESKIAQLEKEYESKLNKQRLMAMNISRISPVSSMKLAAMNLCNTGIKEYERFKNSVDNYRTQYSEWRLSLYKNYDRRISDNKIFNIKDMPEYMFISSSLKNSIRRTLPDLALMLLGAILFFILSYVSFLKYDVR